MFKVRLSCPLFAQPLKESDLQRLNEAIDRINAQEANTVTTQQESSDDSENLRTNPE